MSRRVWPAALLLSGLAAAPVHAAACCLSSSAFGIGRLAPWEEFAVLLGASASPVVGRWDAQAAWRPNEPGIAENEWRAQLSALYALHQRLQLSGRAPLVLTRRDFVDEHATGGGLGDSQLALRYEPIFQGEYAFLPEVAVTAGVTVPSGRVTDAKALAEQLGTEVTGRGAWVLTASVSIELARNIWFLQAAGGVALPLPSTTSSGAIQQFGSGWQATLAGGAELYKDLVLSLVGRYGYEGPIRAEPVDALSGLPTGAPMVETSQSQAYDLGGGLNASYKLNPHWTLQGGVDVGLLATGLGANRQGRVTGNLAVRYAYF